MTTTELRDLLATMLAGVAGGDPKHWRDLIGPIEERPIIENIHTNWRVAPTATGYELHAIEMAIEIARAEHPRIHDPR